MTSSNNNSSTTPPPWLRWFVSDASKGIVDRLSLAPLGCHYFLDVEHDAWEVTLFVSRTEIVGGPKDGRAISSGLNVDLKAVGEAFDTQPLSWWQSEPVSQDDDLGSHVSFEGTARGHRVWLRILHNAPEGFGPGRLMHAQHGTVEDIW